MKRNPRRFLLLLLAGAVLTPLSGYFAGLVLGKELLIWFIATLFGMLHGLKATLVMLALPGMLGAAWAWPVTCVVFPLAALFVRGTAQTPFIFAAIGAAAGAAVAYAWIASGLKPLQSDLASYLVAGAVGGLGVGAIFGIAVWRLDVMQTRPPANPFR